MITKVFIVAFKFFYKHEMYKKGYKEQNKE